MTKLFISHSSHDDTFVRNLRAALADHGQEGWIDSRELRGGDPLWSTIQTAISDASAFAVVVSTDAHQSKWVGKELTHALSIQKQRVKGTFPVIPLSLERHQARRAGAILRRGADVHLGQQHRWRRGGRHESPPRSHGQAPSR